MNINKNIMENKYKELEKSQQEQLEKYNNKEKFISFMNNTSFQYAKYFWFADILQEKLSERIDVINLWIIPLTLHEKKDFYDGWKRNINYCRTAYYDVNHQHKIEKNSKEELTEQQKFRITTWEEMDVEERTNKEEDYVDKEIIRIKNLLDEYNKPPIQPEKIKKTKTELTINQIALKYAYEGLQITRENGNDIAKQYGHNSGEKLFQRFTYYSSTTNRKGKPNQCTHKKLDNKIKLIESVIILLPTNDQERAKEEVSILKKIYDTDYQ